MVDFRTALELFDPVWEVLYPAERFRILRLLIDTVDVDTEHGKIGISFRPLGIAILKDEMTAASQYLTPSE